jgi:hypothetical protein
MMRLGTGWVTGSSAGSSASTSRKEVLLSVAVASRPQRGQENNVNAKQNMTGAQKKSYSNASCDAHGAYGSLVVVVHLSRGWLEAASPRPTRAGSTAAAPDPPRTVASLNLSLHTTISLLPTMAAEAFRTANAASSLAATVFQMATGIRDTIHLVSSSSLILARPHCSLIVHARSRCLRTRRSPTSLRKTRGQ